MNRPRRQHYGSLSFVVPPTWKDASVLTFLESSGLSEGPFQHSFVLTRDTLRQGKTFEALCDDQVAELQRSLQHFELRDRQVVAHEAGPCTRINTRWQLYTGEWIRQVQYTFCRDREVVVLTGSARDDTFDNYEPVFANIARSFRFE